MQEYYYDLHIIIIILISYLIATDVDINNSGICITSKCHCEKTFKISVRDKLGCTIYSQNISSSGNNCTSFTANAGCVPYRVKVEDDNKLIYNGAITGHS